MRISSLALAATLSFTCLFAATGVAAEKGENRLGLRVLKFHDLIVPGTTLRCELDNDSDSGFIVQQPWEGKDVSITPFANGQLAPLAQTMQSERKESPDPLILLVSYKEVKGDVEMNVEFLFNRKMNDQGTYDGVVVFAQAVYAKNAEGAEVRSLKPLGVRKLSCKPSN
jgi:hypothetical protein